MTEEDSIFREALGGRGVLIVMRETETSDLLTRSFEQRTSYRVEIQSNRGKQKAVLLRSRDRARVEGFACGVVDGIKLANG